MRYWTEFIDNGVLGTAALGWLIAQILKVIFVFVTQKKLDMARIVGAGGMPSSHSAFVTSLCTSIGLVDGFDSTLFALSFGIAAVVMYDAAGVRRAAGQQAQVLNKMIDEWGHGDFTSAETRLKELLGHTPIEVIAGAVLGIIIAVIRFA